MHLVGQGIAKSVIASTPARQVVRVFNVRLHSVSCRPMCNVDSRALIDAAVQVISHRAFLVNLKLPLPAMMI